MDSLLCQIEASALLAGSNHLPLFGGTFEGGYQIQQHPGELARLICCLSAHAPFKSSLEIGIASGGTARFIREHVPIVQTAVIDDGLHPTFPLWAENREHVRGNNRTSRLREFIGDSHSPAAANFVRSVVKDLGEPFDLVAIDGDHSFDGVLADWKLIAPHLAPGALVWFHDIKAVDDVARFWGDLCSARVVPDFQVILETDNLGIGVIRINGQRPLL